MASQNSSVLISQIYNSRKIILELMEKQGYDVQDYSNFSVNEVNSMKQNNQLDMLLETSHDKVNDENPKKKIYIRYYLNVTLFIIIKDEPNETLINELKHIWESEGIFIVIESIKRLQYNILNHALVPPHRVMLGSEVKDIMKKYNITDVVQFPDISRFDPVARVIGLRPGQVCHIVRPSKTAIEANYYRICI